MGDCKSSKWVQTSPGVLLRSFHKQSDMWFTFCRHVQWPETEAAVPLKLEKYLSWESRLWPDQERCMRAKPEEVSFYPVVFGLGYKWITAIEDQFTFMRGLSHFKIVLEWCLLICESISFFTVGSFSSFFFFLVTDWHVAYEITNVRPSLNFIQVELNFNMEKFLMLMKIISHLKNVIKRSQTEMCFGVSVQHFLSLFKVLWQRL